MIWLVRFLILATGVACGTSIWQREWFLVYGYAALIVALSLPYHIRRDRRREEREHALQTAIARHFEREASQ